MKALLLAGGLGTRLRPLTENLPKPMTPVFNRPWLEHLILHLKEQGISEFVLAVQYQANKVQSHFGDGRRLGVRIEYAVEQELLGTAGAIKNAEPLLGERFLVFNADIIHHIDLIPLLEFHRRHGGWVTIGLTEVEDPTQYGVVEQTPSGKIVRFVEKPRLEEAPSRCINAGIYVMEKEALQSIPNHRATSIERETFPALIQQGAGVYGARVRGYWMDMGTVERYLQLHRDILDGRCPLPAPVPKAGQGVWLGAVQMSAGVQLIPPVMVDDGAILESGAVVGPYAVVGKGAVIGVGCTVSHTVVWDNTRVEAGAKLSGTVVSPRFTTKVEIPHTVSAMEAVMQR
ncbi:nucleotidyltransferase [Alicyclobacillus contaminans]|uniref:nucleotidyltransferase family protein n=1 Tax=Alicyclobacillus contaminans TaxID=392016 RepID=UPI00054ECF45|nr:NDP-sugar synthase [Alicyclobacillus contaminans]GMA49263.1 nucleotidyltransferase [Alicyclobacillus contaminans]